MADDDCTHCGTPVGPGSVVRVVGRDRNGSVVKTCTKCFAERQPEKPTTLADVVPPKKTSTKKRR